MNTIPRHICLALAVILFAAFIMRVWGIWNAEHTDEYNEVFEALRVCSGNLNYNRWFKRTLLYVLAFEYGICFVVGWILNIFSSPLDFAARVVRDMTPLFLIGRATNVLLGTASVYILYKVGDRVAGPVCGVISALFMTFTTVHVVSSHLINVDILMTFLILLSLLFAVRIYQSGGMTRDYALTGFLIGLAIQTKLPSVVMIVPFCLAHFFHKMRSAESFRYFIDKNLLAGLLMLIVGFLLGNIAILGNPAAFIKSRMGFANLDLGASAYDFVINGWLFYLKSLVEDMGAGVFLLSICGIIHAVITRHRERLILVSFIVLYYPLMAQETKLVFSRYMIPLIPFLDIIAAAFIKVLADRFSVIRSGVVLSILAVLLVSFTVPDIVRYNVSVTGKNTRYLAKQWIEANIPPNSKILLQAGRSINSDSPPIAESEASLKVKISRIRTYLSENKGTFDDSGIVDKNALIYYELLLKIEPAIAYDITSTEFYRNIQSYDYYTVNGYQYAVIKADSQDYYRSMHGAQANLRLHLFYEALAVRGKLIKEFDPSIYHAGERFRIYAF